ncbi:hypothetical protein PENTCL1PPCAC_22341, partial [Pristionchus entomophagus]
MAHQWRDDEGRRAILPTVIEIHTIHYLQDIGSDPLPSAIQHQLSLLHSTPSSVRVELSSTRIMLEACLDPYDPDVTMGIDSVSSHRHDL